MIQPSTLGCGDVPYFPWRLRGRACFQAYRSSSAPLTNNRRSAKSSELRRPGKRVKVEDDQVGQGRGDCIERSKPCRLRRGFWRLAGRVFWKRRRRRALFSDGVVSHSLSHFSTSAGRLAVSVARRLRGRGLRARHRPGSRACTVMDAY